MPFPAYDELLVGPSCVFMIASGYFSSIILSGFSNRPELISPFLCYPSTKLVFFFSFSFFDEKIGVLVPIIETKGVLPRPFHYRKKKEGIHLSGG
jgi:hypothetical protein